MKLLFLTGTRAIWGYIQPLADLCRTEGVDYDVCVTNMMMLPAYGDLLSEIRKEGYNATGEIYSSLEGHNHATMAKSLGVFYNSFIDTLVRVKPDWLVVLGDTGEQLMGAIAGGYCYVPTAHIQAGELSGNIDGLARHAIGKFAHLHFAAHEDAAERLRKLGEEEFRIHNVGHPGLDPLVHGTHASVDELERKYGLSLKDPYILVTVHPVTEDFERVQDQATALIDALESFPQRKIWILSNNDAGASLLWDAIMKRRKADTHLFNNLPRHEYATLLKHAQCMVGNSSAGLIEAPTFGVPAVNIGRRQHKRLQGKNVINANFTTDEIRAAVTKAADPAFKASLQGMQNPYGDGNSARKVLDILRATPIDDRLLVKRLTY